MSRWFDRNSALGKARQPELGKAAQRAGDRVLAGHTYRPRLGRMAE